VPPQTAPCERDPAIGGFDPVTEWVWNHNPIHRGYDQIMSTPAVANLNDDNGDGRVDEDDVPDVVFTAYAGDAYGSAGVVVAVSGDDGQTLWSTVDAGGFKPMGAGGVAVADLDGTGRMRVVVPASGGLLCLDATGAFEWFAAVPPSIWGMPAIGDLEGDGLADIVFGAAVVDGTGTVRWQSAAGTGGSTFHSFPVDLGSPWRIAARHPRVRPPSNCTHCTPATPSSSTATTRDVWTPA